MVNTQEEKCVHERFYGKIPDYTKFLKTWGEIGFLRSIATVKSKLEDSGKTCMFLGYEQNRNGGT